LHFLSTNHLKRQFSQQFLSQFFKNLKLEIFGVSVTLILEKKLP